MALADYWLCDVCDRKTFYDSNLDYDDDQRTHPRRHDGRMLPRGAGDMACLCVRCAETHSVIVTPKSNTEREKDPPHDPR